MLQAYRRAELGIRSRARYGRPGIATPRPVRVALAQPGGFEFGGIGRAMLYTTQSWAVTSGAPTWLAIDARGTGSLWQLPLRLAQACHQLIAAKLASGLDLLHLNVAGRGSTLRKIVLSEVAGAIGLPTIVHLHDYDYRQDLERRSVPVAYLVRRMFRRARRVIVLGERDRLIVERDLGVSPLRVTKLPNAVPDPGPAPNRSPSSSLVRIVFLGHLDNRKGVPELLAALATAELERRRWRLDCAGGGEIERFRAMAGELGLAARIEFHGWLAQAEVTALCRSADVFVLPSHAEGQAMSLLEAMAHGLAIVSTPVGAHLEAIDPDVHALMVTPGDVVELRQAICRLIDEPELRTRLAVAARQRYMENFTIDRYAARLSRIYHDTIAALPSAATALPATPLDSLRT